jgi:hypothetical protein
MRFGAGRTAAALAAASSVLLLSGCGETGPGVAAVVEGDRITDQEVDDFARVLCALGAVPGTESGSPARAARATALQILVGNELAEDIADVDAVAQSDIAPSVEGLTATRDQVPADVRDTLDEVAREFAAAEVAIATLGGEALSEEGGQASEEDARVEGNRLRNEYARTADIEIDPRFGRLVDGAIQPGSGSLSVPVSEQARQATEPQPADSFVAGLPASQKCA